MTHLFDHLTALLAYWDPASLSWIAGTEEQVTEIMVDLELNLEEIRDQVDVTEGLELNEETKYDY